MEKLSEETANTLIEQISRANSEMTNIVDDFANLSKSISSLFLIELIQVHIVNVEKFFKASFITKWYWENKMNKSQKAIDEYTNLIEDIKKCNVNENIHSLSDDS